MKSRYFLFPGIFAVFLLLLTEILLRIGLLFFGYPFFRPSDYLYSAFYDNMKEVREKEIKRNGDVKNVLILGGSVVSTPWSHMESRLDTILQKHYGKGNRYAFYNIASAGQTSRDILLKYNLLDDKRFDLVIYYEAINENRANNIPAKYFKQDYSHIGWYRDIELLRSRSEINLTVIPYVLQKMVGAIQDKLTHRIYVSHEKVDPQFEKFGSDIKTAGPYHSNISGIIKIAQSRGDKLLLLSYASYFPENVILTGDDKDSEHFAGCRFASPVKIWGKPENTKKGIGVHNSIIRKLAKQHKTLFLDMENEMPKDPKLFCDVCHVSEPGAQRFAHEIAEFIIRCKILE
ncbi:hypothetical protein LZD49_07590 [Dyadobacter sp. CY261]|uniref:hypothetical protein n=1 Tax=Dyadobacter sp. CY261 TaxID=2907203 RepID=UPI001F2765B1|nr:hypothetical protein [Dyadobacter sp. CY261]MCF0070330.1 hypothetical protein [Dyadobacter sp. CY261]